MRENNGMFEETIFGLSDILTGDVVKCSSNLYLNGFSWSIGSFLRKNCNKFTEKGDFCVFLRAFEKISGRNQVGSHTLHIPGEDDVRSITEADKECCNLLVNKIIKETKSWSLPVKECLINNATIMINLERNIAFKVVLRDVITKGTDYGNQSFRKQVVSVVNDNISNKQDLSHFRLLLVKQLLINIMDKAGYSLGNNDTDENNIRLHVTLNPANVMEAHPVVCGVVKNSCTHRKEINVNIEDYQRERDMEQASVHKYGTLALEASWKGFISSLASSAVKLDLLHSRISLPVSLDLSESVILNRERSYKGPQFLLYNYARLVSILKQFDEKVNKGIYPPMISIDAVDFTLLSEQEEWMLLFNYILPYPSLLVNVVDPTSLKFDTHIIMQFLQNLCVCISAYYSRFRILAEPRVHLLPLMYARLYLITAIKNIMMSIFQLYDVVPISQM